MQAPPPLSFLQAPSCHPTNSAKAQKAYCSLQEITQLVLPAYFSTVTPDRSDSQKQILENYGAGFYVHHSAKKKKS